MREIVCDNFAGGGGASVGIERALGHVDVAINHDPRALAIHRANHPNTKHYEQSITSIDPLVATEGRPVGLAWFSPDCKHFSKAKGGKPVKKNIRDLAWVVVHWAQRVCPRVIILENVEEFTTWGPLDPVTQRPCKLQKGLEFRRWLKALRAEGYNVEYKELRACEFRTPTTRKRLFLVARCDGRPIVWPKPTNGPGLAPYRTAAECIDWTLPTKSIFGRRRPLAENTLRRIARGIVRYVLDAANPYVIPLTHQGDSRTYDLGQPFRTITSANRGELAFVTPHLMTNTTGHRGRGLGEPVPTATTGNHHYMVAPWFVPRYGERPGQEPRTLSVEEPMPTVVPTGNGAQLCAAYMCQHNTGSTGHPMSKPVSTICATGTHQQVVTSHLMVQRNNSFGQSMEEPLRTVTAGANHFAEVRTFLSKYGGGEMPVVSLGESSFVISDIQMRMLSPRELFRAQGFPDSYVIDPEYNGKPLTKTAQYKACGNSVCPPLAESMVRANVTLREVEDEPVRSYGGLFA